eukprot:5156080-Prymnesium_polylepis.1
MHTEPDGPAASAHKDLRPRTPLGLFGRERPLRHEPGTRRPDHRAPSRASSALSTLPAPALTQTAPPRAPRTSSGPGRCRRNRRQQRGTWAARAPTRAARMETVRAEAAVSGLEANRCSDARVGGIVLGTQGQSPHQPAETAKQQQRERALSAH